ncbi:MAG: hypothetical protein V1926_00540 [Candidatus Peregrinibacteria bacterium]
MRILALETDLNRIKDRYCNNDEELVLMTRFHGLRFFFASIKLFLIAVLLAAFAVAALFSGLTWEWTLPIFALLGLVLVGFPLIKYFIDWRFDVLIVTTDKIILVDQTLLFRQEINPIHFEHVGRIVTQTQFYDLFNFGMLKIHIEEGIESQAIVLKYVPHLLESAAKISSAVTRHQRHEKKETLGSLLEERERFIINGR